jgi:hypothetical protein
VATYKEFEKFVRGKFPVKDAPKDTPKGFMCIEVPCGDDRSHLVFISPGYAHEQQGDIANVVAMFGDISGNTLGQALDAVHNLPLGGLAKIDKTIALRHCIPLADVDESEIATAIFFMAFGADILEQKFVGGDKF